MEDSKVITNQELLACYTKIKEFIKFLETEKANLEKLEEENDG